VPRDRYLEAIDLIRRQTLGEPMPLPPGPPPMMESEAEWTCPHCGEANPGHFGLCWQCETPREEGSQFTVRSSRMRDMNF